MKVSAFTIVRDAVRLDYPAVESIRSILPLVDEYVVLVGDSCDNTLELIRGINSPKLVVKESVWDPELRRGGAVLAQQTNLALDHCQGDWCFYLQADEVIHENDWDRIRSSMQRGLKRPSVEGLSFRYHHFMGDYNLTSLLIYKRQVRIVRNGLGIRSAKDACGFSREGRKLRTQATGAWVYHYGWVRPPETMGRKQAQLEIFYSEDPEKTPPATNLRSRAAEINVVAAASAWDYDLSACVPFRGTHPEVMRVRIAAKNWQTPPCHAAPWWRNRVYWQGLWKKTFKGFGTKIKQRQKAA